jgi:hypothetical protein
LVTVLIWLISRMDEADAGVQLGVAAQAQARDNRVAPEVCQSVSGRVRGSPKRVMTLVLKLVMAVMWSPAVVMTRRQ